MKVKSESEVTQSCPTLSDPMDYSLPGSSIHGIFQARALEWGAIAFSGALCLELYKSPSLSKFQKESNSFIIVGLKYLILSVFFLTEILLL